MRKSGLSLNAEGFLEQVENRAERLLQDWCFKLLATGSIKPREDDLRELQSISRRGMQLLVIDLFNDECVMGNRNKFVSISNEATEKGRHTPVIKSAAQEAEKNEFRKLIWSISVGLKPLEALFESIGVPYKKPKRGSGTAIQNCIRVIADLHLAGISD